MMSAGEAIKEARVELNLPPSQFAAAIGVDVEDLGRAGEDDATGRVVLRRVAEVFGLDVSELLRDGVAGRAPTTMLRSFIDHSPEAFGELVSLGVHRELGQFVRHVRRKAWLRDALGKPSLSLPPALEAAARPIGEASRPPHGAGALADEVRARLGLGDGPIPSMRALVQDRLGIDVRFTPTLCSRIAGASVSTGRVRGVLVNLAGKDTAMKGRKWWRTRTTLAHELCHLLFDGDVFAGGQAGPLLIFSPDERPSGQKLVRGYTRFLHVEQRANAFAAYFLAPRSGVQKLFGANEPPQTWESVSRVARHFGISDITAVNVLKNVYGWSDQDRYDLLDEIEGEWAPEREHLDVVPGGATEDAEFRALADEAVARGVLFASTRDRWLNVAAETPRDTTGPAGGTAAEPRSAALAAAEIRDLLSRHQIDAALRVLWDSVDAWIDGGDLDACRALLRTLAPETVDSNVMVSLLAATARASELADDRAEYRASARRALRESGRSASEVDGLIAEEPQRADRS